MPKARKTPEPGHCRLPSLCTIPFMQHIFKLSKESTMFQIYKKAIQRIAVAAVLTLVAFATNAQAQSGFLACRRACSQNCCNSTSNCCLPGPGPSCTCFENCISQC